jgi:AcrR family transcriptional regulator
MLKKRYHHGNLRRTLIDASIAIIEESGPEALTLREVARRAKVSHTAPYRHFQDKSDLLAAVAEQGFIDLRAAIEQAWSHDTPPLDRLRQCGIAYVAFALERTAFFRVMFGAELDPQRHPSARAAAEAAFETLVTVVAACQEAKQVSSGDTRKKACIAWSLVHGISHLAIGHQLTLKSREDIARFIGSSNEVLVNGLGTSRSGSP